MGGLDCDGASYLREGLHHDELADIVLERRAHTQADAAPDVCRQEDQPDHHGSLRRQEEAGCQRGTESVEERRAQGREHLPSTTFRVQGFRVLGFRVCRQEDQPDHHGSLRGEEEAVC